MLPPVIYSSPLRVTTNNKMTIPIASDLAKITNKTNILITQTHLAREIIEKYYVLFPSLH